MQSLNVLFLRQEKFLHKFFFIFFKIFIPLYLQKIETLKLFNMRKLRMGMVGGGKDAFIGAIHRIAANMDGLIELCCGALSINPEIAKASGNRIISS